MDGLAESTLVSSFFMVFNLASDCLEHTADAVRDSAQFEQVG